MRWLILLTLLASPAFAQSGMQFPEAYYCLGTKNESRTMRLQVADTRERQAHGLMFRKELTPYDGMIFEFGQEFYPQMWMKNTYLALDMLFIDKNQKVVQIIRDTVPMSEAIISTDVAITTVIELETGRAAKEGFSTDTILAKGPCPSASAKP